MPPAAQVKLLRAIQEGEVEPVGARKPVKVDVRIVSATNRDLIADVKQGRFREDLFYRLHVFPITVPPLRERPADIPALARHFLALFAAEEGKRIRVDHAGSAAATERLSLAGQYPPARKRGLPRRCARRRRQHRHRRISADHRADIGARHKFGSRRSGRPQPDRLGARYRVGEDVGDQSQGRRKDHRGAHAHGSPRRDELIRRVRLCRNG